MSVSSAGYGVCLEDDAGNSQTFFKSTNGTTYGLQLLENMVANTELGALGQEPDQHALTPPNWTTDYKAPFPGQLTTVMSVSELTAGSQTPVTSLTTANMEIRVLSDTIIPTYFLAAGMWQDRKAEDLESGDDSFITATGTEMDSLDPMVTLCTDQDNDTDDGFDYLQIQLLSADYFAVGSEDFQQQGDALIFVAWDTGTTVW